MKDFSVPMALVDFIPVILFCTATVILIRDMYNVRRQLHRLSLAEPLYS